MKRVLFVLPATGSPWAGHQPRLLWAPLVSAGYDVHACTLADDVACAPDGVPHASVACRGPGDAAALLKLRQHISRLAPALVHAWLPEFDSRWRVLPLANRRQRWLLSQAAFSPACCWLQAHAERRHLAGTVAWTFAQPAACQSAIAAGLPASGVHRIATGIEPLPARKRSRAQCLEQLGLPGEARLIGAAGRLQLPTRWKDLIWAADMLKFLRDDVHLLIWGDGPLRWRLGRFRKQAQIIDKVHFVGPEPDLPDWLPHLDVFWSGSQDDGQPLALLLAMATGVPSVALRSPDTEQLIRHGHSGFLVPPGDRAGIARLTRKLLDEPGYARQMGRCGQAHVVEHFSAGKMAQSFLQLYDQLGC